MLDNIDTKAGKVKIDFKKYLLIEEVIIDFALFETTKTTVRLNEVAMLEDYQNNKINIDINTFLGLCEVELGNARIFQKHIKFLNKNKGKREEI